MPFTIIRNDITKVKADIIVNTANPEPIYANGTDGAIYNAAGADKLLAERKVIGRIGRGDVALTPAFDLKAKYIIHTVGPAWEGGDKGEFEILKNCYAKSLQLAATLKCKSIAFPLIATGVYGFPKDKALTIAQDTIGEFLMKDDNDMDVKLVVFDKKAFCLSSKMFEEVAAYIEDDEVIAKHLEEHGIGRNDFRHMHSRMQNADEEKLFAEKIRRRYAETYDRRPAIKTDSVEVMLEVKPEKDSVLESFNEHTFNPDEFMRDPKDDMSFCDKLFSLIIEKGMDNSEVYKRANMKRAAFSKIQCGDTKKPKKSSVFGLCLALELNMEETIDLLASADLAFNPYDKRDRLVQQCIENKQYNYMEVNNMLWICDQPLIGS